MLVLRRFWNLMLKRIRTFLPLIFSVYSVCLFGQITVNSVYSRYGLGDLERPATGQSTGLGGAGLALRTPNLINFLNPAAYSTQDTNSFIFDVGLRTRYHIYSSPEKEQTFRTINIDHLAAGFPVTRWLKFQAGLVPYSSVGYLVKNNKEQVPVSNEPVDYYFTGSGGINKAYLGFSTELFRHIAVGANASYLFGTLLYSSEIDFPNDVYYFNTMDENRMTLRNFTFQYGAQVYDTLFPGVFVTAGGIYQPQVTMNVTTSRYVYNFPGTGNSQNPLDTIFYADDSRGKVTMPPLWGAGISFQTKRLLVTLDYSEQDWSKALFLGKKDSLRNNRQIAGGIEFTPNRNALQGYLNRVRYRLGGHYADTYLKLRGEPITEFGITFGLGLPYRNTKTMFNLGFEYGQRGTHAQNLIRENYFMMNLSISFYDYWFIKRKFD